MQHSWRLQGEDGEMAIISGRIETVGGKQQPDGDAALLLAGHN